jgi:hypothetical protein
MEICEGNLEGSFSGESERYVKAGSENGSLHRGPVSGDSERKVTFYLLRQPCSLGTVNGM